MSFVRVFVVFVIWIVILALIFNATKPSIVRTRDRLDRIKLGTWSVLLAVVATLITLLTYYRL